MSFPPAKIGFPPAAGNAVGSMLDVISAAEYAMKAAYIIERGVRSYGQSRSKELSER